MNDICSTDFVRINLNKMIFATVVKIVLTLATSKMGKKHSWVTLKIFSYFLFFIYNEK